MAMVFFKTRAAARSKLKAHKLVDNGPDAPKGKRFARQLVKPVRVEQRQVVSDDNMFALAA